MQVSTGDTMNIKNRLNAEFYKKTGTNPKTMALKLQQKLDDIDVLKRRVDAIEKIIKDQINVFTDIDRRLRELEGKK